MDPIHGLIHFNVFEREIIDSPQFQRLHFVLQNSTTYVSYPANKNSRFIHSLGCAHLAGDMLVNGLSKASKNDLLGFLGSCAEFIYRDFIVLSATKKIPDVLEGWENTIRGQSAFQHKPLLKGSDESVPCDQNVIAADHTDPEQVKELPVLFIVDTIWQAIRIAGLVHDIGHLPMSHSFEKAIELFGVIAKDQGDEAQTQKAADLISAISEQSKIASDNDAIYIRGVVEKVFGVEDQPLKDFLKSIEIHELRTLDILYYLAENSRIESYGENDEFYRKLIYTLSLVILISSISEKIEYNRVGLAETRGIALSALKGLVSGDVEADRMDYVIRDGAACGSSLGGYDVRRIVENCILLKHEDDTFSFGFFHRAQSAIEQFYTQRRDGYKYLIFHRTSSRSELCLRHLIANLYWLSLKHPNSTLANCMETFGFLKLGENGVSHLFDEARYSYREFDDNALRSCLWQVLRYCERGNLLPMARLDAQSKSRVALVHLLAEQILHREFRHIYDPLKHQGVRKRIASAIAELRDERELKIEEYDQETHKLVARRFMTNRAARTAFLDGLQQRLDQEFSDPILVVSSLIPPKLYRAPDDETPASERIWLVDSSAQKQSIDDVSPTLKYMNRSADSDTQFRLYFITKDVKFNENAQGVIDRVLNEEFYSLVEQAMQEHEEKGTNDGD